MRKNWRQRQSANKRSSSLSTLPKTKLSPPWGNQRKFHSHRSKKWKAKSRSFPPGRELLFENMPSVAKTSTLSATDSAVAPSTLPKPKTLRAPLMQSSRVFLSPSPLRRLRFDLRSERHVITAFCHTRKSWKKSDVLYSLLLTNLSDAQAK